MRSFFLSVFSCIRTEYRSIRTEYRKIPTRKNSVFGHYSSSDIYFIDKGNKLMCARIVRHEAWLIWIKRNCFPSSVEKFHQKWFFQNVCHKQVRRKQVYNYSEFVCFLFCGKGTSYHLQLKIAACRYFIYKLV